MKKLMLALSALLFTMTACTAKKRDNALPYGAERNLLKIADYDGKEFDVITDSVETKSSSNSSDVKILDETGKIQNQNYVTYKTKAELLDNSPFLGEPNHTYKVKYVLEDKKLKIYKVGKESDFSFEEKSAAQATKLTDGRIAAPLVSYSVSYFSADNSRNENNEVTNKLELIDQDSKTSAIYFKIEKSSKELAELIKKDLHFDAHFFDGEWYFATSMISQNYELKAAADRSVLEWMFRNDAAKVGVKKEENRIAFYSLNMDEKIRGTLTGREENQNVVLSFPASWKQYRMAPSGRGTSVHEQEDTSKAWDQRSLIKLDPTRIGMPTLNFNRSSGAEEDLAGLHIKSEINAQLRDVQIGEDRGRKYFAFLVYMPEAKALVRYAFLQTKPRNDVGPYEPRTYLKEDQHLFGFFSTDIRALVTKDKMNESDYVDTHKLNRFNPKLTSIQYNPSEQTPDWTLSLAEKATLAWNQAFKTAGSGTTIQFNKAKVHVGDIRYNIINIIDDPDGNEPWWGFGPSVADSETGEIISATANVNISNMVQYTRALVRNYVRSRAGELAGSFVASVVLSGTDISVKKVSGQMTVQSTQPLLVTGASLSSAQDLQYFPNLDRKLAKGYQWLPIRNKTRSSSLFGGYNRRAPENNFEIEYENVAHEIQKNKDCNAVREYSAKLNSVADRTSSAEENKIIESCARAIVEPRAVATLVHEMGHNFGLRHNFYGNNDQNNFWPASGNNPQARSSSIMEYSHFDEDTLLSPGFYDIAAIKWGYTNKLLAKDGVNELNSYDSKISIESQSVAKEMRHFKYCTDEEAQGIGPDPMCALHDRGTTAIETVIGYIKSYNYSLAGLRNLEKGRILNLQPEAIALQNANSIFVPVKKFYDYFRLLLEQENPSHGYLETEDTKSFPILLEGITKRLQEQSGVNVDLKSLDRMALNKLINQYYAKGMTRDERKFIEFLDYREAAELSYNFLKSVAFMPDYYCLVKSEAKKENPFSLISFVSIQRSIFNSSGVTVSSCNEKSTQEKIQHDGGVFVAEVGSPVDPLLRNLDPAKSDETPVALGTGYDRAFAAMLLSSRTTLLSQISQRNFMPNFYDEPAKRAELEQLIIDRMVKGVDSGSLGMNAKLKELGIKNFQSLVFENEKPILNLIFGTMVKGEQVPGKPFINSKRQERFTLHRAYVSESLNTPNAKAFTFSGTEFYALPENEVVYKLIDTADALVNIRETKALDLEGIAALKKFLQDRLVSNKDSAAIFTVEQLAKIEKEFASAIENDKVLAKGESFLATVLASEHEIISKIEGEIGAALEKAGKTPENVKKANETRFKTDLIQAGQRLKTPFNLFKETIGQRLDAQNAELIQEIDAYKSNENELNAQTDMIIQAITNSTGE